MPRKTTLVSAARSDSRLGALKILRDQLAVAIDGCESKRDLAALSLRFMDVVEQIEMLTSGLPAAKETGLSEFERRLRERESAPKIARRVRG